MSVATTARLLAVCAAVLLTNPSSALTCVGDCDGDGTISINEIITGVTMALDLQPLAACRVFDRNGNDTIEIDELISAVDFALNGCPPSPPTTPAGPTATATPPAACAGTAPVTATPKPSSACVPIPGMFVDCLETSGLDVGPYEGENGAAVADVDGDGFPDVFMWNTSGGARLFRNLGHGMQFEPAADTAVGWSGSATVRTAAFGDLDNDGKPDLVVAVDKTDTAYFCDDATNYPRNLFRVYRNRGAGEFEDVSTAWGFSEVTVPPGDKAFQGGLSLADLNLDGRLDVVVYQRRADAPPLVFLSQADGRTWKEAGRNVFGDARGPTWNVFFTDSNHDQLQDVFILNDYWDTAPSEHYVRLDRSLTYGERNLLPVFGTHPYSSPMGAATADLDGDGQLDLVVADSGDQHVFSLGSDVGRAWGVAQNPSRFGILQTCWSPAVIDLENDGTPDLFFACAGFRIGWPDRAATFALRNKGQGTFEVAAGLLPHEDLPTWDEGLAVADFDQDGRLDLLTGGEEHPPRLLWNQIPGGRALAIRLKGRRVNTQGIGALITVRAPGLPTQVREMFPGGPTWGSSDTQLLFGLGQATHAQVTVDWRAAGGTAVQTVGLPPGAWVIQEP